MSTRCPEITSHERLRPLSQRFFEPYPPHVLVNTLEDAHLVVSTGCEPRYLLVLDTHGPSGTKTLKSNDVGEFRGRLGIVIYTLLPDADLSTAANLVLELLEINGTAFGFATPQQITQWKHACFHWAKKQKAGDTQGEGQDGITLNWSTNNVEGSEWAQWSVVKKAPEWAFC